MPFYDSGNISQVRKNLIRFCLKNYYTPQLYPCPISASRNEFGIPPKTVFVFNVPRIAYNNTYMNHTSNL